MPRAGAIVKRDLCVYMAEAGDKGVSEDVIQLINRCLQDKMFSGNVDTVAVSRDDDDTFVFEQLGWSLLRKVEKTFRNPRKDETKANLPGSISTILESLSVQEEEDAYEDQKILYFTNLMTHLDTKKLQALVTKVGATNVFLSIVFPDKNTLNFDQIEQVELLQHVFSHLKTVYIASLPEIRKLLSNTLSKKPKRSTAWNVDLEIGPDLKIGVQGYIKCRYNKSAELKSALPKEVAGFQNLSQSSQSEGENGEQLMLPGLSSDVADEDKPSTSASTQLVLASDAVEKETIWTEENGTIIDAANVIPAYYYGDRLVPFDNAEQEHEYKSGEKCLQVLLFTGRETIWPCFLLGDGSDIIVANPKDPGADLKLSALVKALHNLKRVAVVRKVRANNAKLAIGVLAPDISKGCLVYTQLCFADDISIPHLVPLVKEEEPTDSVGEGLSEKETLIDELILGMALEDYNLQEGPVDPGVQVIRDSITRKAIGKKADDPTSNPALAKDNIDLFFEGLVWREDTIKRIERSFPLKELRVKSMERPSGAQIFMKREALEAIEPADGHGEEKKIKLEEDPDADGPLLAISYDDLMDDL